MFKIQLLQACVLASFLFSIRIEASFYSINNKLNYTFDKLLSDFDFVVLTSKNCKACKQLQNNLEKCVLPHKIKIAWVGSELASYKFQKSTNSFNISKIKTSEKKIQKLTTITPKSFLNAKPFRDGLFNCIELNTEILSDSTARANNL
jgi:hypothetical protein